RVADAAPPAGFSRSQHGIDRSALGRRRERPDDVQIHRTECSRGGPMTSAGLIWSAMCYDVLHERLCQAKGTRRCSRAAPESFCVSPTSQGRRDPGGHRPWAAGRQPGAPPGADPDGSRAARGRGSHHPGAVRSSNLEAATVDPGTPTLRDPSGDARRGRAVTRTSYVDASAVVKLIIDEPETREMV